MAHVIPILEYHDISEKPENTQSFHSPYVLSIHTFYDQLKWLYQNRFQTISIDDLFTNHNINNKSIIITFDDGHISNYEYAFPILKKFNFQATFFLVADFIGRENYLTVEHIREMASASMHFESHSLTHSYLIAMEKKAIAFEITQSKKAIENITGIRPRHFCIPYGFYNKTLLQFIKNAGYESAVTERVGYYFSNNKPFKVLPRFTIKTKMKQHEFIYIINRRRLKMMPRYCAENFLFVTKKILGFKKYIQLKSFILRFLS
ncbi:MAG: polysaccharide deacetylase family protein [Thermodesulfobacteriota bacterium]|nr:polysaccharide deacetylase family protein [Thermodesulfobacteriota bacterium]